MFATIATALPHFPQFLPRVRRPPSSPWGDGFVDVGPPFLRAVADWASTWDDELVFLIAPLTRAQPGSRDGLASRIRSALAARACAAARCLGRRVDAEDGESCPAELQVLCDDGILTELTARMAWQRGHGEHCATFLDPRRKWYVAAAASAEDRIRAASFASAVVTALDGFHRDACTPSPRPASSMLEWAMFQSIHSGINAAYVYPEWTLHHETLSVGAWLGHLLRGRPALLPAWLARPAADLLIDRATATSDPAAGMALAHLTPAGLAELKQATNRSLRGGHPVLVEPGSFAGPLRARPDHVLSLLDKHS